VTVVERAPAVRSGGSPIDVRGTAIDVFDRMGLLPRVQAVHIDSRELRFVDAEGRVIGVIPPYDLTNNQTGRDVELPRGELTTLLYDLTKERPIHYRFNDSIETLEDDDSGVEIQFKSGVCRRCDVVIGADGLHSRTRRLVFGPEDRFNHSLGSCFAIFSMPNDMGLSHGGVIYGEAGRSAGVFAVRNSKDVFAFLIFASDDPPFGARPDVQEQYKRTEAVFAGGGWEVPRLLEAMRRAEDLYSDTVSQTRMPVWSSRRVALVGDAAYAPSFRSGQGPASRLSAPTCLPVSWRRKPTLQTRLLLMSGSPDRLSKQTKPWRSKATVTFSCRGRLKRLKRATRSWRASLRGEETACETTIHGKSTACCAFPITTNGFVKKIGSEVETAAAKRRLASSAQRISRLNDIGSPA
jgi:2-polyprenyl-6-methoxyphenol hydroxylase-like FAD-dependent oxidoreductase